MKHTKAAKKYANGVVSGKIPACQLLIKACQRFIDDLKRKDIKFDTKAAERACNFIELLPHIKGEWAKRGLSLKLEPWQQFIVCNVFGFKKKNGWRRFRTVYIEVPRKNAKSTLLAAVALYMLVADDEPGAEIYSAAVTKDQARIIFSVAWAMARKEPELRSEYGLEVAAHSLFVEDTSSKFVPLSADKDSLDGLNIHLGAIDELHAHKSRAVFDVLETGTGSRTQSILWSITTAGSNRAGICYEQRDYVKKILEKVSNDDSYFGLIFTVDDGDDWTQPETWEKANPNYGVSVYPDDIARLCTKAMQLPSAVNNFLTKRLNVWVNADSGFMDMAAWDRCSNPDLDINDFNGLECFAGLDLASKIDINAKVLVFYDEDTGVYSIFGQYYLPEYAVEISKNSQYEGWAATEKIKTTQGNVIDMDLIEDDILADCETFDVTEVAFDPFQATQLSGHMIDEGVPMVEMRPTVLNFSEPMKEFEKLVLEGKLQHNGCPVLTWMLSNVVCHLDQKDNIYPRKERPENKIDGFIAAIMALGRCIVHTDQKSVYETRGVLVV